MFLPLKLLFEQQVSQTPRQTVISLAAVPVQPCGRTPHRHLGGSEWIKRTDVRQERFEPVLSALTCLPLTENQQRLSGCHMSSESPSEMIRVASQASSFSLRSTWPHSFQYKSQYKSKWPLWVTFGSGTISKCVKIQCWEMSPCAFLLQITIKKIFRFQLLIFRQSWPLQRNRQKKRPAVVSQTSNNKQQQSHLRGSGNEEFDKTGTFLLLLL